MSQTQGLCPSNGKRQDGITLVPWERGKALAWDVTCADTFASSHVHIANREAGAVAMEAEHRGRCNSTRICQPHATSWIPVAVETAGSFGPGARGLFEGIGRRLCLISGDPFSTFYLHQHTSVAVQRGNAISILGTVKLFSDVFPLIATFILLHIIYISLIYMYINIYIYIKYIYIYISGTTIYLCIYNIYI